MIYFDRIYRDFISFLNNFLILNRKYWDKICEIKVQSIKWADFIHKTRKNSWAVNVVEDQSQTTGESTSHSRLLAHAKVLIREYAHSRHRELLPG